MKKGIVTKGRIVCLILVLYLVIYGILYIKAENYLREPKIKYFTSDDVIEYGGVEYKLSAKMYTEEELIEEFELDKEKIYDLNTPYNKKYVVVTKNMKRISDEYTDTYPYSLLISKYIQTGVDPSIDDEIQQEGYIPAECLKVGQETVEYQVFSFADINLCKRLWNNAEKEIYYYEFPDYEGREYLTWVRIIN